MGLATPRPSETWCLRVCSLDQTLVQTAGDHSPPAPAPRRTDVRIGSLADISERYLAMSALPPKADMLSLGIDVRFVPIADFGCLPI